VVFYGSVTPFYYTLSARSCLLPLRAHETSTQMGDSNGGGQPGHLSGLSRVRQFRSSHVTCRGLYEHTVLRTLFRRAYRCAMCRKRFYEKIAQEGTVTLALHRERYVLADGRSCWF